MSPRSRPRSRLIVAAVALAALVAVPQANAASQRDAALTRSIRGALASASAPGAIVGVWQQGRAPYVHTFGVRDTTTREPMRANLYMRIGSETKTFTITALLQLVDQGKVSLDDPISKYVDGVTSGDAITLRELAVMRSGLVNYSVVPAFDQLLTDDPHKAWTPQELLSYSIGGPLQFAPGEGFAYSNTNTILLGLVVEKVSGESIGGYIAKHITKPLGMTQTSFPLDSALPSPHASGYSPAADKSIADATNWNPTWTWSAGQMVSTLRDMRIWAPRLATGRGLLSPATQRIRAASVAEVQEPITYGLGLFNVHEWIGHNGSLPGYQTIALYRPQTRTTIVALINSDVPAHGLAPSTIVGKAITSVISPNHLYTLPAAPSGEDE
jgi:D-alanyl-D-alanine carboxypeptidase